MRSCLEWYGKFLDKGLEGLRLKKVQYNVFERDTKNASGKAKKDVSKILENNGFLRMYRPCANAYLRVMQQLYAITLLKKDTYFFVQYPANTDVCYKYLKMKKCKKVAIIHDLESLRRLKTQEAEMKILSMFDVIISHNAKMTSYLRDSGIKSDIFELDIFDYLLPEDMKINPEHNKKEIVFAGNLVKSQFLQELERIKEVSFLLYGAKFDGLERISQQNNVTYMGSFSSEELIENIQGGWGLVWDGDSLDTCSGSSGEYVRYNCPHKVSMYIVAERPIIIWKEAAMAEYVEKNKLGIAVDSLNEIAERINEITDNQYEEILNNIRKEKARLVKGGTLDAVLDKISF